MIREKKLRSPANVQLNTRLTTRMRLHNTLFIFDLSSLTACIASTHAGLKMPEFSSKFHFDQAHFSSAFAYLGSGCQPDFSMNITKGIRIFKSSHQSFFSDCSRSQPSLKA